MIRRLMVKRRKTMVANLNFMFLNSSGGILCDDLENASVAIVCLAVVSELRIFSVSRCALCDSVVNNSRDNLTHRVTENSPRHREIKLGPHRLARKSQQ